MPLESKRTVKVHEIPAGTTKQQYLDFVEHLCTKPQTTSKSPFSRVTKHFKKKSKLLVGTSASASADEVDEDAKSKDETELTTPPSTLKGTGEQAAPLLNNSQPTVKGWKETTICLQNGLPVGTISFESESLKNEALARHAKDKKSCWKGWIVEDNFKGVTILYEGPNAKFDICAVHGLGGNAIDTWTADRGKMWLRDLLPEHQNFENSRIMTFGYDSDLTDKSNVMVLENWAETLVVSLNQVRTEDKEQKRPLLFVSHSLGGLVVRKAMARLHLTPNCKNITLPQCAIVFLATPHSGSTKADWSNFLVATANLIGGVRQETVKILQSFNTASVWDTAAFLGLDPCPPFRCYAEGAMMDVKGTHQLIVTQGSATLGNNQAHMIMGADHSSICKFNSRHGIFVTITMALWELFNEVTTGGVQQPKTQQDRRMFGQPRFLAHAYPPDRGFWWEGTELNEIQHQLTSTTPFFGRSEELKRLESLARFMTRPKLTVVKGIAGIGKTELLLQFAAKQRGLRNIFFLTSQDEESIDSALSKISTQIAFDMIQDPVTNQDRWRSTPVSERIQIFITWLGDICNKDSLFIIDDVEGFGYSKIPMIIKYPAHHVIVSTRDSNLKGANRDFQEVRLPPLGHHDTVKVLQSTLENLSAEPAYWKGLDSVSHRIQGHPLAARNAIVFMMEYLATYDMPSSTFTDLFESPDPEDRKTFLQFSFEGQSLWDAFHTSLERLELRPNHQSATSFLRILPFLSTNNGYVDDFLKMDKRWLSDCGNELPDIVILKSGYMTISAWLHKLRGVSLYLYNGSSSSAKDLNIHPLMSQYMLLHIDEQRRVSLLRQVLCLFYKLEDRGAKRHSQISPHVRHCIRVYQGLGLSLKSLDLQEAVVKWVEGFLGEEKAKDLEDQDGLGEDPFADPVELPERYRPYEYVRAYSGVCKKSKISLADNRACESRPTWSSTGEIIERLPLQAGVPEWLLEFYRRNRPLFHDGEPEREHGFFKSTTENGVAYLLMATGGQTDHEFVDEVILARDRVAIILQAFPSINAEIVGEEIIDRLIYVAKTAILPLLASLSENDIQMWLLPKVQEERDSYLVSLLEFLFSVIEVLGIESPLVPRPLLGQISNIVSKEQKHNMSIVWVEIYQTLDAYTSNNALHSRFVPLKMRADQRGNALVGHMLALLLQNETLLAEPKGSAEMLSQALSDWRPLSLSNPSTMEYLAATSFCSESQTDMIGKPLLLTVETIAMRGLLKARQKHYRNAAMLLSSTIEGITSKYGLMSMHLGIIAAELASCYNILRLEGKAEACVRRTLQEQQGRTFSARRDRIYLKIALADSYIGRARYNEAIPLLQSIIDRHDTPATLRMMSILRLARSQRRMHDGTQRAFEEGSPLWSGVTLLSHVTGVLVMEYVEELACQISGTPKQQLENSVRLPELIEAVNFVLCRTRDLTESPCGEYYTKVQQEYLGQVKEAVKVNKGKQKRTEEKKGAQIEEKNEMGTLVLSPLSRQGDTYPPDDNKLWSDRLVLSFDGGGVRAISSLLILKRMMLRIRILELTHTDGPAYSSISSSWKRDKSGITRVPGVRGVPELSDRVDEFLPCHYFDYIAGTSTGGLNSIMLGRLGISVDQAIDNFIDFGHAVFGHPGDFDGVPTHNRPKAKCTAADATAAFRNITRSNNRFVVGDSSNPGDIVHEEQEPFFDHRDRTRTMVISSRIHEDLAAAHIWRSYGALENNSASIWEVARATCAHPVYFGPIEIQGVTHFDGGLVANNPSPKVLQEVYLQHNKAPLVFVTIGIGAETKARAQRGGNWRESPALRKLDKYTQFIKAARHSDKAELFTENVTKRWLEVALERAYRLDPEGDLHKVPFDDWRPDSTGKTTLQEIADMTEEYLRIEEVRVMIDRIAIDAVRIRRARALTNRWKTFTRDPSLQPDLASRILRKTPDRWRPTTTRKQPPEQNLIDG